MREEFVALPCVQLGFNEAPALYFSLSAISFNCDYLAPLFKDLRVKPEDGCKDERVWVVTRKGGSLLLNLFWS